MAIPDFQRIMLPLLKIAGDGKTHSPSDAIESLALHFKLTKEEREELLPSGRHAKFDNRVGWVRTYLKKAGLLESTGRAAFCITQRGVEVLMDNPPEINIGFLRKYPEFQEFIKATPKNHQEDEDELKLSQTPEEILESGYQELRRNLAQELLERIKSCSPKFFERLVIELLVKMGYGGSMHDAGQAIGRSGDGGIDGIIKEDKLGLDVIYVQAKRWEGTVGRPVVQAFAGSLEGQRAKKGILITTSQFSSDAKEYVLRIEKKIVLIEGEMLAKLMIDNDAGVSKVTSYDIKKIDSDYFSDEF
jgi:restriction system protein